MNDAINIDNVPYVRMAGAKVIDGVVYVPLAVKAKHKEPDKKTKGEVKKEVIQYVKKMRKRGATLKEIADQLNMDGVPTFSGNGKWYAQTVHRIGG